MSTLHPDTDTKRQRQEDRKRGSGRKRKSSTRTKKIKAPFAEMSYCGWKSCQTPSAAEHVTLPQFTVHVNYVKYLIDTHFITLATGQRLGINVQLRAQLFHKDIARDSQNAISLPMCGFPDSQFYKWAPSLMIMLWPPPADNDVEVWVDAEMLGRAHSNFNTHKEEGTVGECVSVCAS